MKFPSPSSADAVVAITGLSRRFDSKTALNEVSLCVARRGVLAWWVKTARARRL